MSSIDIQNACSLSANETVGTSSLEAASCNFAHTDNLANLTAETAQNRVGDTVRTMTGYANTVVNPVDAIYTDAPFDSVAYGRMGEAWVSLNFNIDYTALAGESFMQCGEPQAICGNFSGFSTV